MFILHPETHRQQRLAFPHFAPRYDVTSCFFIPKAPWPAKPLVAGDWRFGVTRYKHHLKRSLMQLPKSPWPLPSEWAISPLEQLATLFSCCFSYEELPSTCWYPFILVHFSGRAFQLTTSNLILFQTRPGPTLGKTKFHSIALQTVWD